MNCRKCAWFKICRKKNFYIVLTPIGKPQKYKVDWCREFTYNWSYKRGEEE